MADTWIMQSLFEALEIEHGYALGYSDGLGGSASTARWWPSPLSPAILRGWNWCWYWRGYLPSCLMGLGLLGIPLLGLTLPAVPSDTDQSMAATAPMPAAPVTHTAVVRIATGAVAMRRGRAAAVRPGPSAQDPPTATRQRRVAGLAEGQNTRPVQNPAKSRPTISIDQKAAWMREEQSSPSVPDAAVSPATERHYSVQEIASLWSLSTDAVRDLFHKEPGVLVIGRESRRGRRAYQTLRIPESILLRVHRRLSRA